MNAETEKETMKALNLKQFRQLSLLLLAIILVSCTKNDYRQALPTSPMALVSVDAGQESGLGGQALLRQVFGMTDGEDAGLDLSQRVYLFETADGNLGLCAAMRSADHMVETITALADKGKCKVVDKVGEAFVSVVDSTWVLAFDDTSLLLMGPVLQADQQGMQARLVRMLHQDEERGGMSSPMFQTLDTIQAPMAIVAQLQALPERLATPFMLGVPRGVEPSQVVLAAGLKSQDKCLLMRGRTLSFNKSVDKQLKQAARVFRPLDGRYLNTLPADAFMGLFVNVDGEQFLPLMQQNEALQAMLLGVNTAVDMNKIIKSIRGEIVVIVPEFATQEVNMSMGAQLSNAQWLSDVGYWKASCTRGASLTPWGACGYHYQNGNSHFFFTVDATRQPELSFASGTTADLAIHALQPAEHPISDLAQQHMKGARIGLAIHLDRLHTNEGIAATLFPFLNTMFGDATTLVYQSTDSTTDR